MRRGLRLQERRRTTEYTEDTEGEKKTPRLESSARNPINPTRYRADLLHGLLLFHPLPCIPWFPPFSALKSMSVSEICGSLFFVFVPLISLSIATSATMGGQTIRTGFNEEL